MFENLYQKTFRAFCIFRGLLLFVHENHESHEQSRIMEKPIPKTFRDFRVFRGQFPLLKPPPSKS